MTKRNIRLLASGFLISGLLLTAFQTINGSSAESGGNERTEALEADLRVMEEKAVQLELENDHLREEYDKLVAMQSDDYSDYQETEDFDEFDEETESAEEAEEDNEETEEETSSTATEYTIVISEGEPSSVIASQLENYGLIDDFFEFNDYMEDNDLIRRVRPGEFTVTSDMTRDQIIEAIIH